MIFTHEKAHRASHITNCHRVNSLSCLFFLHSFDFFLNFFLKSKDKMNFRDHSRRRSLHSLPASPTRRSEGSVDECLRIHIIPGGSRVARGSLLGRLTLLIVIPECSTLPIRVCFGQVCLSPAETYFLNYRTQTLRLSLLPTKRASLFCVTSPST